MDQQLEEIKVEGTSYQRHRCCLCVYILLIPFILNPDQLEMKSRIGPSVLCMFTWVLFVLIWDMHQSSSGWICVAGCEYSLCVCVCVHGCVHDCLCACVCVSVHVWRVASQCCYWVELGTQNWSSFPSVGLRHHWVLEPTSQWDQTGEEKSLVSWSPLDPATSNRIYICNENALSSPSSSPSFSYL